MPENTRNIKRVFPVEIKIQACEDYLSGKYTEREICEKYGFCFDEKRNYSAGFRRWIKQYKLKGRSAFTSVKHLKFYSAELKKKAVEDYITGQHTLSEIAIKYDISSIILLGRWVKKYKSNIKLKASRCIRERKQKKDFRKKYSREVKINACKDYLSGKYTARDVCEKYGIYLYGNSSPSLTRWVRRYIKFGEEAFTDIMSSSHYPEEIKKKAILDYLSGNYSFLAIAYKYSISSETTVKKWVEQYKACRKKRTSEKPKGASQQGSVKNTEAENVTCMQPTLQFKHGKGIKYPVEIKIRACQEYLSGQYTVREICEKYGIYFNRRSRTSCLLLIWVKKYRVEGEQTFNNKPSKCYSAELKLNAVMDYLSGEYSISEIIEKYQISTRCVLQDWIRKYNAGIELRDSISVRKYNIRMAGARRKTTLEERKDIVNYCIQHDNNYAQTAEFYEVSYGQVYDWVRKYKEKGVEGLIDRRGRHKPEEELTEMERLIQENRRLQRKLKEKDMMVELLKKVKELEGR